MLPWSENLKGQEPKLMNADDFNPKERAFPFKDCDGFIAVTAEAVTFRMQRGPLRDVGGVNGCQIDDVIKFAVDTVRVLNMKFPSRENALAITNLEQAMLWLEARRLDRVARDVEGRDKA